jgi:hypothetical protein
MTKVVEKKPAASETTTSTGDWRQSWGKADDHKLTAAAAEPKIPSPSMLPHADTSRPDPLKMPAEYSKPRVEEKIGAIPMTSTVTASSASTPAPMPAKAPSGDIKPALNSEITLMPPPSVPRISPVPSAKAPAVVAPPVARTEVAPLPPGMRSVADAATAAGQDAKYIPVPTAAVPDPRLTPNVPQPIRPQGMPATPQYPKMNNTAARPQMAYTPSMPPVDPGVANAFSPTPPKEALAKGGNAFSPMAPAPMPMPAQAYAMTPVPQGAPAMQAGHNVPQMMSSLHDALYPSQREWAAESLSAVDWRTHPQVVQALVTAAKEDPAATVRASCVRCLAKMNVNTVPVVTAVQALRGDTDPRVRQEVEQALSVLTAPAAPQSLPQLQPAGGVAPR